MPGRRGERVELPWQLAAVLFDADARSAMQIARAAVVAKAGPEREHAIERRSG